MNKERLKQYDNLYMTIAESVSLMSHAIRNKVGSVLVKDNNIIAYGFNGTPTGLSNVCEIEDENGKLTTKPEVIHSEVNLLSKAAKAGSSTDNSTLYITLSPCVNCAVLLIQSGIKKVIYKNEYRDLKGIDLLRSVGIIVEKF